MATANVMSSSSSHRTSTLHRHVHLDKILDRPGPYTDQAFQAGQTVKEFLRRQCKVLVIGAGGLGCEMVTNLALCGFADIHVIDMDTIDVSNLNRQFLFRQKDVGRSKAETAAEFVMSRVKGVRVTPYFGKIQDKDEAYYMQFNIIICGLDSVEARRWINATLVNMVDEDNPESLKPLIDGGTEGFKGQARVILPTITSCYECSLDMLHRQVVYPICTIANTPRLPEHCIEWASELEWPRVFGGTDRKMDKDDPETVQWILSRAQQRARQHNIEGVTWQLTQGVIKNIIPAIASTNAVVAAACTQEALKFATTCAPYLNNYMMYTGNEGVYAYTFEHERRPDCPVCGGESRPMRCTSDMTLEAVMEFLAETQDLQLKRPSLSGPNGPLFFQAPASLRASTEGNLTKTLEQLNLSDGDEITVTDAALPFQLSLSLTMTA